MFDPNKPVQTRDGRKARIICTDANKDSGNHYPIVALVTRHSRLEYAERFRADGKCDDALFNRPMDLINIEEGEG